MIPDRVLRFIWTLFFFFFNDTATTEIYTLSLHDALPICPPADVLWIAVKTTPLETARRPTPDTDKVDAIVPLLIGMDHAALLRSPRTRTGFCPPPFRQKLGASPPGHVVHRFPFAR